MRQVWVEANDLVHRARGRRTVCGRPVLAPLSSEASEGLCRKCYPPAAKDPAAVSLGRRGGAKGGKARAEKLSPERRSQIARDAANKRWSSGLEAHADGFVHRREPVAEPPRHPLADVWDQCRRWDARYEAFMRRGGR